MAGFEAGCSSVTEEGYLKDGAALAARDIESRAQFAEYPGFIARSRCRARGALLSFEAHAIFIITPALIRRLR
jgi:hypothetical protein